MVIKEDDMKREDGYIIHWKTKGAKDGIRRFQSYAVAPTRSGMVGQEIGEAAKQRQRIENRDAPRGYKSNGGNKVYRDPQELRRQSQNNRSNNERNRPESPRGEERRPAALKKETIADKFKAFNKKRWTKSYKALYRHRKNFTTDELINTMGRLGVEADLKRKMGGITVNTTRNGADVFKNLASIAGSGLGLWNAYASVQNAYNFYKGTGKKMLPNALGKGTINGIPKPKSKGKRRD